MFGVKPRTINRVVRELNANPALVRDWSPVGSAGAGCLRRGPAVVPDQLIQPPEAAAFIALELDHPSALQELLDNE